MKIRIPPAHRGVGALLIVVVSILTPTAWGQALAGPFAASYTLTNLGSVPGLPTPYGGLTLLSGSTNTLLIGGAANAPAGSIYSVGLTRDAGGHVTGFSGNASLFSTATYVDGGLTYAPGGVLLYTGYPINTLGQIEPGSASPDKVLTLTGLGVNGSVGSVAFAPNSEFKILSYSANTWYTGTLTADGAGTFNLGGVVLNATLQGGLEGAAYVPPGSAVFGPGSVLVAEYGLGNVVTYLTDANYNPLPASRQLFITGLSGAEGAFIDPVTGDFLFSTFGGGNHVVRVSGGFVPPPPPGPIGVPDSASTLTLFCLGIAALALFRRRLRLH